MKKKVTLPLPIFSVKLILIWGDSSSRSGIGVSSLFHLFIAKPNNFGNILIRFYPLFGKCVPVS